jgi:hypothetical protein
VGFFKYTIFVKNNKMAEKKFFVDINLQGSDINNLKADTLDITTNLASANTKRIVYWSDQYYYSDGTSWNIMGVTGSAGGDLTGTYPNPTVDGLQGNPVSNATPSTGQTLQWNGSAWVPGAIPNGGSGGGGIVYYLNYQNTTDISPTTGLPTSPVAVSQLGITYNVGTGSVTSANLTNGSYSLVCGFVTITGTPGVTDIPGGLWDFNIWASVAGSGGSTNQTQFQIRIYKYNSSTGVYTSLANSDDVYIYDPVTTAQYIANVTMPQTTILSTERIYIELWAQKNVTQSRQVVFYFDSLHPSHVHTTIPSVAGTGVVKVVNGVFQSPASTIVDSDISATAAISVSKLSMSTSKILGRTTAGTGSVEEITVATALGYTPEDQANKSTDVSLGTSDTLYPTQNAVKVYTDNILGNSNALVYKGTIDCSTNPNYPAADAGWMYIASVAGKIGGASGIDVEVGDMIICNTDGTVSGNQATVGQYWNVIQKNIVGAVTGPASSINNTIPVFDGTTGKIIKQGIITDTGTNIGIGTTTPTEKLEVDGTYKLGPAGGILFGSYGAGTNLDMSSLNTGGWTGVSKISTSDTNGTVFFGTYGLNSSLISSHWTVGSSSSTTGYDLTTGIHLLKNGNVGIGTTTPAYKLDTLGNVRLKDISAQLTIDSATWSELKYGDDNYFRAQGDQAIISGPLIRLFDGSQETVRVTGGNVSIGTTVTSPTARLHVNNTSSANSFLVEDNNNVDSSPFVIDNLGKVGVGLINPTAPLHVRSIEIPSDSETIAQFDVSDDSSYFRISNATGVDSNFIPTLQGYNASDKIALYLFGNGTNDTGTEPLLNHDVRIGSSEVVNRPLFRWSNFGNIKMTMLANGDLGIGTSTPSAKLEVNGNVKISTVANATTNTGKILVSDNGIVKYRTAAETISDILTVTNTGTSGAATLTGTTLNIPVYEESLIPKLQGNEIWRGATFRNNSTTIDTTAGITLSTSGTNTARSVGTTSYATKSIRLGVTASITATGRYSGMRGSVLLWYVTGGFLYTGEFNISDTATATGTHNFWGVASSTADLAIGGSNNDQPSALTNIIAFANDSGDANLQIMYNDASGTATKTDLGASFPSNRTAGAAITTIYSCYLYNAPGSTDVIYRIVNKETGVVAQGVLNTNLPASTVGLNFFGVRTMGTSGGGVNNSGQFDVYRLGVYSL